MLKWLSLRVRGVMVAAVVLLIESTLSAATRAAQPDILLLMPDQMRGDCLSILGHPAVRTPNLDALAREGALFRRAYSTVPSCIPARRSLLTGLFPQTSGVVGFRAKRITESTLPQSLAEAGYSTVLVGRYMHQIPKDEPYGYQQQILGSTHVDNDDYDQHLQESAPETGGIRNLVKKLGVTYNGWEANPWPLADELHPTAWIVQQSRHVLTQVATDKPIFLTTSFYAPHPPLFPPKQYFNTYLNMVLPKPARGNWVDWKALSPKGDRSGQRVRLEGEILHRSQAGYYGLIEHLDAEIASLIHDFKQRSERADRPWVIVLTSDHGEMMGDHGYFRKCEPYEGSANIPLLITGSLQLGFRAGARSRQPVGLEDIMPTLLELAGAKIPQPMDGISLVPALRGENQVIREWLHFEHSPCYGQEQAFHALTDGRFKYIWRPTDGAEQLFDLDSDLREEYDLTQDSAQRELVELWRLRIIQRLAGRPEGFSDGHKLIPNRPYPAVQR